MATESVEPVLTRDQMIQKNPLGVLLDDPSDFVTWKCLEVLSNNSQPPIEWFDQVRTILEKGDSTEGTPQNIVWKRLYHWYLIVAHTQPNEDVKAFNFAATQCRVLEGNGHNYLVELVLEQLVRWPWREKPDVGNFLAGVLNSVIGNGSTESSWVEQVGVIAIRFRDRRTTELVIQRLEALAKLLEDASQRNRCGQIGLDIFRFIKYEAVVEFLLAELRAQLLPAK